MSHAHGAYLGGIRTIEDIRQRCHIDAETGCWHWRMGKSEGVPRIHVIRSDGTTQAMRGRRAALYLQRGKDLPAGFLAFATEDCDSDDCCNPEHTRSGNRNAHGLAVAKSGKAKNLPSRLAAARRVARTVLAKLDVEKVQHIRSSPLSTYALAKVYGVSQNAIHRARIGASWSDHAPNSSVFNRSREAA